MQIVLSSFLLYMQFGAQTLGLQSPGLGSISAGHIQQPIHQQIGQQTLAQKTSGNLVYTISMQIHVLFFLFLLYYWKESPPHPTQFLF